MKIRHGLPAGAPSHQNNQGIILEHVNKKKIVLAIGLALSAYGAAHADQPSSTPVQTQQQGEAGPARRSQPYPQAPAVQLLPATPLPFLAPRPQDQVSGLKWGSFVVYPEVSLSGLYDDNIYATPTNTVHDWVTIISPAVSVKSAWSKNMLNFRAGTDIDRYHSYSSEDTADYWANVDGRYDLSANANVYAGGGFSRNHEDRATPDAVLNSTKPTLYTETRGYVGAYRRLGRVALRVGGTYEKLDYNNGVTDTGTPINNNDRDRTLTALGGRLSYSFAPGYDLFGQAATDTRRYVQYYDDSGYHRDSDGYRVALGGSVNLAKRLTGEAYVGHLLQNYSDARLADVSAPYFGGEIKWFATPQTTATGFVDRSVEETTLAGSSSSLDTTVGARIEHWVAPRLKVNVRAAYIHSDFQGYDLTDGAYRVDKLLDAGAGLRYDVSRYVYVGADYRFLRRESNVPDGNYYRNQIMFTVGSQFAPLKSFAEGGALASAARAPTGIGGFYAGVQAGYGGLNTTLFSPRGNSGTLTSDFGDSAAVGGVFAGYGLEFNPWYLGLELEGDNGNLEWNHNHYPNERVFGTQSGASYGISARLGYVLPGGMLYGRAGLVRTDFHTTYSPSSGVSFAQDNTQNGRRYGLGAEVWAAGNAFWRLDYTYTNYNGYVMDYQTGADDFRNREGLFRLGLGWHLGADRKSRPAPPRPDYSGFYGGVQVGHGALTTALNAYHGNDGTNLSAGYGGFGVTSGVFAGYGHTWGKVYAGLELEAEASNAAWAHERVTSGGGRTYSVRKNGGYGGALRVGYVLSGGALLYGRYGLQDTTFHTIYKQGNSSPYDENNRLRGRRFGVGVELPASRNMFWRVDYTYTKYPALDFTTAAGNPDVVGMDTVESLFRLGLLYRF